MNAVNNAFSSAEMNKKSSEREDLWKRMCFIKSVLMNLSRVLQSENLERSYFNFNMSCVISRNNISFYSLALFDFELRMGAPKSFQCLIQPCCLQSPMHAPLILFCLPLYISRRFPSPLLITIHFLSTYYAQSPCPASFPHVF